MLTHPSGLFSEYLILAARGCWTLKFLHVLEFDQALVAHVAIGVGDPLKNFKGEHLKLGLKFHTWAPITLGVVGYPHETLPGDVARGRCDQVDTNLQRVPPTTTAGRWQNATICMSVNYYILLFMIYWDLRPNVNSPDQLVPGGGVVADTMNLPH